MKYPFHKPNEALGTQCKLQLSMNHFLLLLNGSLLSQYLNPTRFVLQLFYISHLSHQNHGMWLYVVRGLQYVPTNKGIHNGRANFLHKIPLQNSIYLVQLITFLESPTSNQLDFYLYFLLFFYFFIIIVFFLNILLFNF